MLVDQGVVEQATGDSCCLYLPYLDAVCFQLFIEELSRTYADDFLHTISATRALQRMPQNLTVPRMQFPSKFPGLRALQNNGRRQEI